MAVMNSHFTGHELRCGIAPYSVIVPYFFESDDGHCVTVNSDRYIAMLNNYVQPQLQLRGINEQELWFQQDGATAHTSRASMAVLRRLFPGHIISRYGNISWPPRSPDLSICDYFLWSYLKSKVYLDRSHTLDDIKLAITDQISNIDGEILQRTVRQRLPECVESDGRHLKNGIYK